MFDMDPAGLDSMSSHISSLKQEQDAALTVRQPVLEAARRRASMTEEEKEAARQKKEERKRKKEAKKQRERELKEQQELAEQAEAIARAQQLAKAAQEVIHRETACLPLLH